MMPGCSALARCAACVDDEQTRAGDRGDDLLELRRRGGRVVGAGDGQRRRGDGRQLVAQVEFGDGLAASGVALGGGGGHHLLGVVACIGVSLAEFGGEPARDDGLRHRATAVLPHRRRTFQPRLGRWQLRAGAQQHKSVDALRVAGGQTHRRHAAQRQTDQVRAFDAQTVEQGDDVVGQIVDRVRPGGHRGRAVAAGVVTDHHEPLLQLGQSAGPTSGGWTPASWTARRPGRRRRPVTTLWTSTAFRGDASPTML